MTVIEYVAVWAKVTKHGGAIHITRHGQPTGPQLDPTICEITLHATAQEAVGVATLIAAGHPPRYTLTLENKG